MNNNIGCHISGGKELIQDAAFNIVTNKINTFQIFTGSPQRFDFTPPSPQNMAFLADTDLTYVIHSPYWVSFFNEKVSKMYLKYLHYLKENWFPIKRQQLLFVSHTSSFQGSREHMLVYMRRFLIEAIKRCGPYIKLCLENDSGVKNGVAPSVKDLIQLKNEFSHPSLGVTIDTEHAYAAGEHPHDLDYSQADVIHLNSIPRYVKFGGHLDRHSNTHLEESKIGTVFVEIIKKTSKPNTPIILERRPDEIIKKDIELYRSI